MMTSNVDVAPNMFFDVQTLNEIVARYPQTLPVLQRFGFDTCCGGGLALRTAAERHGLELTEVIAALQLVVNEQ